jgi:hypothetical protein
MRNFCSHWVHLWHWLNSRQKKSRTIHVQRFRGFDQEWIASAQPRVSQLQMDYRRLAEVSGDTNLFAIPFSSYIFTVLWESVSSEKGLHDLPVSASEVGLKDRRDQFWKLDEIACGRWCLFELQSEIVNSLKESWDSSVPSISISFFSIPTAPLVWLTENHTIDSSFRNNADWMIECLTIICIFHGKIPSPWPVFSTHHKLRFSTQIPAYTW